MGYDEPLSALDSTFFAIEGASTHMHVGAVATFERGPLANTEGGVDFQKIRQYTEWALQSRPRYRQRLLRIPGINRYLWRDDDRFNIEFHLRHTCLPRPGDERQLKRLAGRVFSHQLDRSRPPWELWVVEGLDGDRFALIFKIHHAMIDGVAGMDLMQALFRGTPDASVPDVGSWQARPAPTPGDLVREEWQRRSGIPGALVRAVRSAAREPRQSLAASKLIARGVGRTLRNGLVPASKTSINPKELGPYRRFDWTEMPLNDVKFIKRTLGGTINDAALAVLATYQDRLPAFAALFAEAGQRWPDFFAEVEGLAELSAEERNGVLERLAEDHVTDARDDRGTDEVQCEAFAHHGLD